MGASDEVIRHHAERHPCTTGGPLEIYCPCGACFITVCTECEELVFLTSRVHVWCRHAQAIKDAGYLA